MRRSTIAAIVAAAVLVAAGIWVVIDRRSPHVDTGPIAMDKALPALQGVSLDGAPLTSKDLRGHVAVINAWATWCGPCHHDQPILSALARKYGSKVRFLGIDYRDDRAAARRFWERYHTPYPSLFDASGRFASVLGFPYLPVIYVVDPSGKIRWEILKQTDEQEVSSAIDRVLSAQGS
jgi:cytochrome c biogenesis protein CcmG/thiol:disulfide interchange protein DsbE